MSNTKFQVKIEGIKELGEMLDTLDTRIQRAILRGAVRVGSQTLQRRTAENARTAINDGGKLAQNVVVSTRASNTREIQRRGYVMAGIKVAGRQYGRTRKGRDGKVVGSVYNPGRIWHFTEFGTAARAQKKFKKKARRTGSVKAHPFIRPAMNAAQGEVLQAMQDYCAKRFEKIALKTLAGAMLAND